MELCSLCRILSGEFIVYLYRILRQSSKKISFFLHISIIYSNFVVKITQRGPRGMLTECIQWGERRTFEYLLLKRVLVHVRE